MQIVAKDSLDTNHIRLANTFFSLIYREDTYHKKVKIQKG